MAKTPNFSSERLFLSVKRLHLAPRYRMNVTLRTGTKLPS